MLQQLALLYSYQTPTTTSTHVSGALATVFIIAAIIGIIGIVAMWKVFKKAGKPGWAAIIPVYNYWVLFEIAGKPGWWALFVFLSIIPYVGSLVFLVLYVIAALEIAKRFSKTTAFAVFGLVIFSVVGYCILGFGDAKYKGGSQGSTPKAPAANPPKPATT